MFAYGQEEVEVVFAFVKRRCFFCHRDVASGCETAIVRLSGDCRRSFGNRRNDTFIYGGYAFIRAAPCHRRDCGVRRDYGSRQRASRSFFQFQCLGPTETPVTGTTSTLSSSSQAVNAKEVRATMNANNANLIFSFLFVFSYSNINNYILSGIESLTENVHMEK